MDNGNRVRVIGESTDEFGYVFHTGDEPRGAGLGEAAGLFVTSVRNHLPAKWNRIDAQLQALPVEGYSSQCALLYDILHDDEDIEGLITGEYKGDVKGASSYDGIVVATSRRRVLFLGSGPSGKDVAEMPHENIEAIEHAKSGLLKASPSPDATLTAIRWATFRPTPGSLPNAFGTSLPRPPRPGRRRRAWLKLNCRRSTRARSLG